ncbi:MAG: hypothetical protein ND866_30905 [Pyrinomonadaceae bacterium]|nr:hypothetical protein [Pyrinomonadaceae bacterium]
MATIRRLLCLTGFTVCLFVSSPVSAQKQPGLELSNPRFKQEQNVNFSPRFTATKSGRDDDDYFPAEFRPPRGPQEKVIYSKWSSKAEAIAHNTSSKTISTVVWEYIFFSDASMRRESGKYRIHTKIQLRAGETKTIRGEVLAPVLSPYQKVLPLRIEYTDGTVWQSP